MAQIRNADPKNPTGSYERLLGNERIGKLITKVQSAVIASGSELEKIIATLVKEDGRLIEDADAFFEKTKTLIKSGVFLLTKRALKKSKHIDFLKQEPDFVIFKIEEFNKHCHIIELKDGHVFDTKKASGEKETLRKFESYVATRIQYSTSIHVCAFNQNDKKKIMEGFKGCFFEEEILTGIEFCELLGIDYNSILERRKRDAKDNLEYFLNELSKIPEVKSYFNDLV